MLLRKLITKTRNEKKLSCLFLAVIISAYALNLTSELDDKEKYPDYANIVIFYTVCNPIKLPQIGSDFLTNGFLKEQINCFSYKVLGNDRLLPFAFSTSLVFLVYLLGHCISNDKVIGLIGCTAFAINPLFTNFDTSPTYDQTWAFFIILSVVLLYKKPVISPFFYILGITLKILAIAYLPIYLYQIFSRKIKNWKLTLCIVIILLMIGTLIMISIDGIGFHPERLELGLIVLLQNIWIIFPIMVVFVALALIFKPKAKMNGMKITSLWIVWMLISTMLIYIFSDENQFQYRYVPFAAFLSVFIGMAIVNFGNKVIEIRTDAKKALFDKRNKTKQ